MTTTNTTTRKDFESLKRDFEQAIASGTDYSAELLALSSAVARSVLRKVIDPQQKTATEKDRVSNSGVNPSLVTLRREVATDLFLLESTADNANKATAVCYNANGDLQTVTADKDALTAVNSLIEKVLGDGIDLIQEASVAILEQSERTADHAEGWLDRPYTVRRLSKKVLIRTTDNATWKEEETTPMQEVYRAVRRYIQNSRAVQTDPRNGYSYLEEMATTDGEYGMEAVYRRLQKWADLGGHESTIDGRADRYTADSQTVADYHAIIKGLNLTDRHITIISYRMRGYGIDAIATAMGVSNGSIYNAIKAIRKKAEAIGFTPAMWKEMTDGAKAPIEQPQPQKDKSNKVVYGGHTATTKGICEAIADFIGIDRFELNF